MAKKDVLKELIFEQGDKVACLMFGLGVVTHSDWGICKVDFESGHSAEYTPRGIIVHDFAKTRTLYHKGTRIEIDDRKAYRKPDFETLQYVLHAQRGDRWALYQFSHTVQDTVYDMPKCVMVGGFEDLACNFVSFDANKVKPGEVRE